ncbi:AAA domain-containing protein [Dactylonectria estremocensis]|uniref:AAA domain-containing protein n=1 Tax=Dactylonectria estremocensis TaxID=1079267 RepID=A0A9P9IZ72_9HYPO|nr:AAA domain-containing protein [Dactylonectria estremocensis]
MSPTNVYIIGAQCTGKTALANMLESAFEAASYISPPAIVHEVVSSVIKMHNFTTLDTTSSPDRCLALQTLILEGQRDAERETLRHARWRHARWIISDRSGLVPIVYARRNLGCETAENMTATAAWKELRTGMSTPLILVFEAGANWLVDDGVRLMPQDWDDWVSVHREFCQLLQQAGLPYSIIPCSIPGIGERAAFVWSKWRAAVLSDNHEPIVEANGCS